MDLKVSRKENRLQPSGPVEVLVSDIFDIYPVYGKDDPNLITDVEMLDDERIELLDRAMFACVKQKGQDPLDIEDGIPYAELLVGEIDNAVVLLKLQQAVRQEGPGVKLDYGSVRHNGREYLTLNVALTSAV